MWWLKNDEDNLLLSMWKKRVRRHPAKTFIISRFDKNGRKTPNRIHKVSWKNADKTIKSFAKGLCNLGLRELDSVAIFSPNNPRWIFSCLSVLLCRCVCVPIYPTSKEDDVWWILSDSEAKFVICGNMEHAEKVLSVKKKLKNLSKIIVMEPLINNSNDFIMGFNDIVELGERGNVTDLAIEERLNRIKEEDLALIIYTSGTTGRPKGVELIYKNFIAQRPLEKEFNFSNDEVFFSHLPFCHVFGFSVDLLLGINIGATLFVIDNLETKELRENLKECRPTFMASVPRLWEKIYITIQQRITSQNFLKKFIASWALEVGQEVFINKQEGKWLSPLLWGQNLFSTKFMNKIKSQVGLDRLKYSATGGGPIDAKLINFFGGIGIKLYQGFGLTETAPIIIASSPKNNKVGAVGKPLPNVELKIADDGELLVRAPQVMKGYHNNPQATSEAIDKNGWFSTGDIADIDEEGFVTITDRKKEIIITSGGKNIAPQPIENEFNIDPYIEMASLIGDRRKFLSALIVPEFEMIRNWLKDKTGEAIEDNETLLKHPRVIELINNRIENVNKKLAKYEQIKKFVVVSNPFSVETGELTPSMKRKRRVIHEKYKDKIEEMYKESQEQTP
ncbi:MAG: long-chain fatty acid--CoA ligase [Desulfobacterales bacterium]|nr:long-chain fatty acid--CoA ligase [Desulfobacterales bacterium]